MGSWQYPVVSEWHQKAPDQRPLMPPIIRRSNAIEHPAHLTELRVLFIAERASYFDISCSAITATMMRGITRPDEISADRKCIANLANDNTRIVSMKIRSNDDLPRIEDLLTVTIFA